MIGKRQFSVLSAHYSAKARALSGSGALRAGRLLKTEDRKLRSGFTLLELMIVMFILIILVAVALPQYQKWVLHARESVLRNNLFQMRKLIDQYAADKGKLPQSLEELVSGGYMREVPDDPITGEKNWNVTTGEDPNSTEGGQGVTDVHSTSTDISTDGRPYSEW
ncbi:MAG: prepilin-type N-terminal cleavage/methylation domain-containing protein [Pyrinomonadaceae bacterium]